MKAQGKGAGWQVAALGGFLVVGVGRAEAACGPAALQGNDWSAAVVAQSASCGETTMMRGFSQPRAMTVVTLYDPRVQFSFDSAALQPEAMPTLDRLADYLLSTEGSSRFARIEGHTDATGGDDYNLGLSERRAATVRLYLVGRGVPDGRLTSVGFGRTAPLPDTSPYDGANRRVQFRLSFQP